jgi:outer membrane protein assembly factor BamB
MRQSFLLKWCLTGLLLLQMAVLAQAYVTRLTPLREALAAYPHIFLVKVEKLDPDKPSVVLQVSEELKGKAPFQKLPVNLTADSEGQRDQHTPKLLKRLAPDLPLVLFASKMGQRYVAFAYTNGTWFQLLGTPGDDKAVRWRFTHCEPYMRRTFKGSTAELETIIRDGLSGKKEPPPPDAKEEPGLGPEIKPEKKTAPTASTGLVSGPVFGVIPTFVILGPLALLATLFPAVFGGLALLMRRWLVLLTIASINSTLFLLHAWLRGMLKDSWWGTPTALWSVLTVVTLLGAFWSWHRQRTLPTLATATPRRSEQVILWLVSLLGLAIVLWCTLHGILLRPPWNSLLVIWSVAWVGTLYTIYLRWAAQRQQKVRPATEGVMLWALVFACAGLGATTLPRPTAEGVDVAWKFEPADRGAILSSPLVHGDRVYIAAIHSAGFAQYGAVYCLERSTGKEVWRFDDEGNMKQVFSTPCLADGRLFLGEGLHENQGCRFFCLDAGTSKKLWQFDTTSHIESSPCVAAGKVFFGAGDDGLYCLDAVTGNKCWQFQKGLHIDASPVVVGNRVYCGSGVSRTHKMTRIFCLDRDTGNVVWSHDTPLPVWGSPAADGRQVIFGLGNGRLDQSVTSPAQPAGAVLCVHADTGEKVWEYRVADGVLARPVMDAAHVYFASRDHHCYCVERTQGQLVWQHDLGSPVVAAPALLGSRLHVAASDGLVVCLNAGTGQRLWSFDLAGLTQTQPQLYSSPAAVGSDGDQEAPSLFVGAALKDTLSSTAVLYCLQNAARQPDETQKVAQGEQR